MNKKEMKYWIKQAIEKQYDRSDVNDLLTTTYEEKKITKEEWQELLDMYDEEKAEVERLKIGWNQRRKLRKLLKASHKSMKKDLEIMTELNTRLKVLNKKEIKHLAELKIKMVMAILGNTEKNLPGLNEIFDITDDKGYELKHEDMIKWSVEEIEELMDDLMTALDKEI